MTAVSLFDMLASAARGDESESGVSSMAEKLIANQLEDLRRVKEYEEPCLAQGWRDAELHSRLTREVYSLYEQWAVETKEVLERVAEYTKSKLTIKGQSDLEGAYLRVRARLKLTPEQIERATAQVRRGEIISGDRNELRNRLRA
jgi:hypothetical protein